MSKFTLKQYKSAEDIIIASCNDTYDNEDIPEFTRENIHEILFGGVDQDENGVEEFNFDDHVEMIKMQGVWGYITHTDSTIHYWIDKTRNFKVKDLLHFFAHEIGHGTGTPLEDHFQEEMRAEEFASVAMLAYQFSEEVLKNSLNENNKDS